MTQKQKLYLSLAITTIVLVILLLGGGWLLIKTIKNKARDLAQKQHSIQTLYQNWHNLEKAKRGLKDQFNIEIIEGTLLEKDQGLTFVLELETIAQRVGCRQEIKSIALSQPRKKEEESKEIAFQTTLWCPFDNVFGFLVYFENMKYLAELQNIRLSRLSEQALKKEKELGELPAGSLEAILDIRVKVK